LPSTGFEDTEQQDDDATTATTIPSQVRQGSTPVS